MPKAQAPLKTKEQRLADILEILRNITSVGIPMNDPGFLETKKELMDWMEHGDGRQVKIPFARYGRIADIILPAREGRKPTCVLRATEELKQQAKEEGEQ